jgi:CheY-like chemotaxis protein
MKSTDGQLDILLVDDSVPIRSLLAEALTDAGNRVTLARDGEEALEMFAPGKFHVVLTDFAMPNANGTDLADAIKERAPQQRIILFSGYTEALPRGGKPKSIDLVLRKPMSLQDLTTAVSIVGQSALPTN